MGFLLSSGGAVPRRRFSYHSTLRPYARCESNHASPWSLSCPRASWTQPSRFDPSARTNQISGTSCASVPKTLFSAARWIRNDDGQRLASLRNGLNHGCEIVFLSLTRCGSHSYSWGRGRPRESCCGDPDESPGRHTPRLAWKENEVTRRCPRACLRTTGSSRRPRPRPRNAMRFGLQRSGIPPPAARARRFGRWRA